MVISRRYSRIPPVIAPSWIDKSCYSTVIFRLEDIEALRSRPGFNPNPLRYGIEINRPPVIPSDCSWSRAKITWVPDTSRYGICATVRT
jgi:hypothetical protein